MEQDKELQKFIKYYNDEKECEIAIREMFDYTYSENEKSELAIKKKALSKTISYIYDCYGVDPDKVNKAVASTSVSSVLLGTAVGAATLATTNEFLGMKASTVLSITTGTGAAILYLFRSYHRNKTLKNYDENARKAAEMENLMRDYYKQDKSLLSQDVVINDKKQSIKAR